MARVAGRNLALSWIAGIFCVGFVGALVWLAIPMGPMLIEMVGTGLRNAFP